MLLSAFKWRNFEKVYIFKTLEVQVIVLTRYVGEPEIQKLEKSGRKVAEF